MTKKVLFFGDPGIDDTVALLYAYYKDDIELVGIVAGYGNVTKEIAIRNIRYVLQKIGHTDIPVFGGAERPLTGELSYYYPEIHGVQGLGFITPPGAPKEFENFFGVTELIRQYENELIIVNTGRLTSLATLFTLYPSLMETVKAYYIMGGAFFFPGNVTPVSEANFYGDPVAADIVMKYAKNVNIYPLNVTQRAIVTPEMVNFIDAQGRSDLIKPMMDFYYYNFYHEKYPELKGAPVHDVLTFMAFVNNGLFNYGHSKVVINQSPGLTRGQSIGEFRPEEDKLKDYNRPFHRIALQLNYKKFYQDFMSTMTGIEI